MYIYRWQRVFAFFVVALSLTTILSMLWKISHDFEKPSESYQDVLTYEQKRSHQSVVYKGAGAIDKNPVQNQPNYNLHIFYYAWYGDPDKDGEYVHWNHPILPSWREKNRTRPLVRYKPPDDIGASFYPKLGPYSSRDVEVMKNHMKQIKEAGIGVISVSWYPPNMHDGEGIYDPSLMTLLFDQAHLFQLKVCLHIEPFKERSIETMRQALRHIGTTHGKHPAFYKYTDQTTGESLPLYYIYDSYLTDFKVWKKMLSPASNELDNIHLTVRGTDLDGKFIALLVEQKHMENIARSGFDGFYTYFGTDTFTFGSNPLNWHSIASFAIQKELLFIPSVAPGYNDERIRPWNKMNSRGRHNGAYYEHAFRNALSTNPSIISITSFNEWHEGTQIEEASPHMSSSTPYLNYLPNTSNHYLKLTNKWSFKFTEKKILQNVS